MSRPSYHPKLLCLPFTLPGVSGSEFVNRAALHLNKLPRRIAFGSCLYPLIPQSPLDRIRALKPDLMLWLGDNTYGDLIGLDVAYDALFSRPDMKALLESVPCMATLDDHDYGYNGADSTNSTRNYACELFSRKFIQSVPSSGGVYSSNIFSDGTHNVQVIMLDMRYFCSPHTRDIAGNILVSSDTSRTFLGDLQWAWLEASLQNTQVDLNIIASPIQFAADTSGADCWGNFPHEKSRLQTALKLCGDVFIISGDMHFGDIQRDAETGVFDVTSSGLTHGGLFTTVPPSSSRMPNVPVFLGRNFGIIDIHMTLRQVYVALFDINGQRVRTLHIDFVTGYGNAYVNAHNLN